MNINFTQKAANVINNMISCAMLLGHTYVGSEHLLLSLSSEDKSISKKLLLDKGISYEVILESIIEISGRGDKSKLDSSDITPKLTEIIRDSAKTDQNKADARIGTEHLLYSLLCQKDCIATRILHKKAVNIQELKNIVLRYVGSDEIIKPAEKDTDTSQSYSKKYPTISQYTKDMTAECDKYDPLIDRDEEIDRVIRILSRRSKNNPALIGEPGVGKTAIVEGLAKRIKENNHDNVLKNKRVLSLDLSSMLAGAKYRGEFEERLKNLICEVKSRDDVLLFIDEMHMLVGAGSAEGAIDAANILKPAISRAEIQIVGATTIREYRKYIEKDTALERRFAPVYVQEPSIEQSKRILMGLKSGYESHHNVKISECAVASACELSHRYLNDRFLPDKAIDLIDEAASKKRLDHFSQNQYSEDYKKQITVIEKELDSAINQRDFSLAKVLREKIKNIKSVSETENNKNVDENSDLTVDEEDIVSLISEQTKIPVNIIKKNKTIDIDSLKEDLNSKIIGQNDAISKICNRLARSTFYLNNSNKPISSFLFVGPTGVGKTECARIIANNVFVLKNSFIKLDMSEYKEAHSISRIIGAPPGYIGYDEGSMLCERIRRNPYSLILFDEIEKAHPDVYSLLLQLLDEGVLSDSHGRTADFKNTIIIMTSNAGQGFVKHGNIGFTRELEKNKTNENIYLKNYFSPEFINRIDSIVHFASLTKDDITMIAERKIEEIKIRLAKINIQLRYTDEIAKSISDRIGSTEYGAREVIRYVQNNLEVAITKMMIDENIKEYAIISLYISDGSIKVKKEEA